jgi:hypothetical protein
MHRRTFLKSAAALTAACALPLRADSPPDKLILSAPLTHSDWMLHPHIEWGSPGVHHMLDLCKSFGLSKIYWRILDGGRAMYPSKFLGTGDAWQPDSFWSPQSPADKTLIKRFDPNMTDAARRAIFDKCAALDYSKFDPFAEALSHGHKIGLQIHAWITINEDDHGWGLQSEFTKSHPQFRWIKRDGTPYHSQLSFSFPEVRAYKLSILQELLTSYPTLDGLFLDWIRTGDVRDNPQTDPEGVANFGYEQPNLDSFQSQYHLDPHTLPNSDPRWLATRALPQTLFMRSASQLANSHSKPLTALVAHPWLYRGFLDKIAGNLPGLLLDLPTWSAEKLIDSATPAGYYLPGGSMSAATTSLQSETHHTLPITPFAWMPSSTTQFQSDFTTAATSGATELLLWEADYLETYQSTPNLQTLMTSHARASS